MTRNIKILDSPKEFLDNLSEEDFENLLNEYEFKYRDLSYTIKE